MSYPHGSPTSRSTESTARPLLSGLDPTTPEAHLASLGLELVDDAGPDELRARHLPGTTGRIMTFSAIAHARVP